MADESGGWSSLFRLLLEHPEKTTLLFLVLVGVWRYLLELIRENREVSRHETLLESLLRENQELRDRLLKETKLRQDHSDEQ